MNVNILKFDSLINISMSLLPELQNHASNKHFSFILKNSKVLAMGINQPFKTHVFAHRKRYLFSSIHSELCVVNRLRHKTDFSSCKLVNIRLSTDSIKFNKPILRNSRPCSRCLEWLLDLNFKQIWYTTDNGFEKL